MIRAALSKSKFAKNVLTLMTGTGVAQIIPLAISPLLTRLYSPNEFAIFAMYSAILAIFSVIACLRFEIAIPIPKEEKEAFELVLLAVISNIFFTILVSFFIAFFTAQIGTITDHKLDGYLWMIPAGVFLSGGYAAFQYWATRKRNFSKVARTRVAQSLGCGFTQLGLGFYGYTPLGLLLGSLFQAGAGVISLGGLFFKDVKHLVKNIKLIDIKKTFIRYDKFPKYSTWEALANSAGIQIPVILIATYTIGGEAGFLMLAMRLMSTPMSLIGGAVSQVFLAEAPLKHQTGELRTFTLNTAWSLFKIGLIPILGIGVLAPFLIPIIFGENWARAGDMITWMAPWFLMQFVTSPISMSLHIVNKQRTALILQIFGVVFRIICVYVSMLYFDSYIVEAYAVSGLVFYVIYFLSVRKSLT